MEKYFISDKNISNFIVSLSKKYTVYTPYVKNDKQLIGVFSEDTPYFFNTYRISTPVIKSILFDTIEKVVPFPEPQKKMNVVFGIKACDLASLPIMDYVFCKGDFQDPLYIKNRENTIIISSDCADCLETCFCTLAGNNPYPEEKYFDINLSPVRDGYIFTVATDKGKKLINMKYLQKATDVQLKHVETNREKIKNKVTTQVATQGYNIVISAQKAVMDNFESDAWKEAAETCVECGACNFVCPTCHCFLLSDHNENRYRQWDACQYKGFAIVAGGANPRQKLYERLRNRYVKKFDFFQKNIKLSACTGCGRCILACIGKIDIREVLKNCVTSKKPC